MGRRRKKLKFEIVGRTDEGHPVVRGLFTLVNERGVSLELAVYEMHRRGMMPDWTHFIRSAIQKGWKLDRTISRLELTIRDVYGHEWADGWRQRIDQLRQR